MISIRFLAAVAVVWLLSAGTSPAVNDGSQSDQLGSFAPTSASSYPDGVPNPHTYGKHSLLASPYCAIALDYDNDGRQDVLETHRYGSPILYRNVCDDACGRPEFQPICAFDITVDALSSARGCSAADFDNDGYVDLFIAHETLPMLLRNRGPGNVPRFENVGMSLAWVDNGRIEYALAGSWSGCWTDINHDGRVDLVVERGEQGKTSTPKSGLPLSEILVLINHSSPGVTSFVPDMMYGERGYSVEQMLLSAVVR